MDQALKILPWDSEFFGYPVAQLLGPWSNDVEPWCVENEIRCLYWLTPDEQPGLKAIDVRTELTWQAREVESQRLAVAQLEDYVKLARIMPSVFPDSRFYRDSNFGTEKADEMFLTRVRNDLADVNRDVLVDDERLGFVTVDYVSNPMRLALIAVHPSARGKGLGTRLVRGFQHAISLRGAECGYVVTNGTNQAALHLYQSQGFVISKREYWYHFWFDR